MGHGAYTQPTPRLLYVHDDLSAEVAERFGPASQAVALTRALFDAVGRDGERVVILCLADQVERIVAQGAHAPFGLALSIGPAGERVARTLHARTGWFPRRRVLGLTREEDGRGGYRLVTTTGAPLGAQLAATAQNLDRSAPIERDDPVYEGIALNQRQPFRLHHPGEPRSGDAVLQRCYSRQGVDDIAHGAQANHQDPGA